MKFLCLLLFLLIPFFSNAILRVDINRGNAAKIPIFLAKCGNSNDNLNEIFNIIQYDLNTSDIFNVKEIKNVQCDDDASLISAKSIESGSIILTIAIQTQSSDKNNLEVKYRLIDSSMKKQLIGKSLESNIANYRKIAHTISDGIYTRITGDKGYFNTSIAHIAEFNGIKKLAIIDHDGANLHFITDGKFLTLTPRFSPDGKQIVYMSYIKTQGKVYVKNLEKNTDELIGDFSGVVSAPRFSPDGKSVIVARSIDNVTDIYKVSLLNKSNNKLTVKSAINTSPSYSPDQKKIVFNSDRGGLPQLYVMNTDGSDQKRISFGEGSYRTPVWSPRGDLIAFTKISKKSFYIGVIKPDGTDERIITTGHLVEGPSWAPNGRLLIFTKEEPSVNGKRSVSKIYSIDITGKNERMLPTQYNASDPSWSDII
jgi:TolB protein